MADPTGAALAIIGLAATCVELLKYGFVAMDRKEEVQNLRGQLDLQALLLRRWAENVFFVPADGGEIAKLIPMEYCDVIRANLERLVKLFEDGGGLVKRYTSDLEALAVLDRNNDQQKRLFQWLALRKVKRPSAIRWAIRDAVKLERLLRHVTSIRSTLAELLPPDLERLKLQILIDAVSETTGDALVAIHRASAVMAAQSPADAPIMQAVEAALLLRQQLPQWLNQADAARASAKALMIRDATYEPSGMPQDLARWPTLITSATRGFNAREVIVEWRLCEADVDPASFERDVLVLVNLLSCLENHPDTRLPRCLGYIKSTSVVGLRYGLVLSLPTAPTETWTSREYTSLHESLVARRYPMPDLSLRFKIALDLACSVLQLLTAGVFHKAIHSNSILLLPSSSVRQVGIENANFSLVGFEFARLDLPGQLSRNAMDSATYDIYRHPSATSAKWASSEYKDWGYVAEYDIYSLGVVLAELGLWRTMPSLRDSGRSNDQAWTDDKFPAFLRRRVELEMPGMAGSCFQKVVDWCLSVKGPQEGRQLRIKMLTEFEEKVIKKLMDCSV